MVSALSRDIPKYTESQSSLAHIRLIKSFDKAAYQMGEAELLPSALREFVNSNADLPTIDELIEKLPMLKNIIG